MKTTDSLIREMHSGIAVLNSEVKNVRQDQKEIKNSLESIKDETIQHSNLIEKNSERIEQHLLYHRQLNKREKWKVGVALTIFVSIVSFLTRIIIK